MIPVEKVREIISKHELLEKELSSNKVDKKNFARISKEYSDLNEILICAKEFLNFYETEKDLEKIINDSSSEEEMRELAKIELDELKKNKILNEKKLKLFLLPKDDADKKDAIIEIRAGTGGLEASLFASDLFKMYEKICIKKKWNLEIISISKSEAGGLKEVISSVKGNNIYSSLKYESGVHRVQRVPDTETQGRVHTSAATVAVLPEPEDVDVKIEDIKLGDFDIIGEYTAKKNRGQNSDLYRKVGCFFRPNYERGILIYSLIKKYQISKWLGGVERISYT